MKIKVIIKDPGKKPRCVNISNTLENLQKTVGGHIETVTLAKDLVIICNEEGRLQGLPHNCNVCGIDFVGTIVFCGVAEGDLCDIPVSFEEMKRIMLRLWRV